MDLFELVKVVLRRWYVVAPIGLIALGFAYHVQVNTPSEYEANGYMQFQTPELDRAEGLGATTIDPVALSQGIKVDSDAIFSVSPLDGQYFSITAAAQVALDATAAVDGVIRDLAARIQMVQEDSSIPEADRIDLRMAAPEIVVGAQQDKSFLANADMFLYNPTTNSPNPYRPDASTGRLLKVAAMGDAGRQRFAELARTDVSFEIEQDTRDAAALLQVLTTGSDPDEVIDAFYDVQMLMAADLDARQARADVAEGQRITLGVLDAPLAASDVSPPIERAVAGTLGLGAILALGAAFGVESLLRHRPGVSRDTGPARVVHELRQSEIASDQASSGTAAIRAGDREDTVSEPPVAGTDENPIAHGSSVVPAIEGPDLPNPPTPSHPVDPVLQSFGPRLNGDALGERGFSQPVDRDLVRSRSVDFVGGGEVLAGHMANPATGVGHGVLVIHDWAGLDDHVKLITERLAAAGFVALAPDLYGGVRPSTLQEAETLIQERSLGAIIEQLSAALDCLERQWFVLGTKSGVFGTSMGGGLALALAAAEPDRVAAAVCYYPVGSYDEVDLTRVAASIIAHVGSDDPLMGAAELSKLTETLERSQAPSVHVRTYPGAGHFFLNHDNEYGTFSEELADLTWTASVEFLASRLWIENSAVATGTTRS